MNITNICNSIKNFIDKARLPKPDISRILVVCASINKKGLSALFSTSKVVKDLQKLGIPTGPMPDGSPNLTIGFIYGLFKEEDRRIMHDMKSIGAALPGSETIVTPLGVGTNTTTGQIVVQNY